MISNLAIAIAACKFELGNIENGKLWIQMTPAGHFSAVDGRPAVIDGKPTKIKSWFIDAASAAQVIAKFNQRKNDMVVDFEHQTLHKEKNGQRADAAAWVGQLEWREGQGLYGLAELTTEAAELVSNKKYRYYSPVLAYDSSGTITDVLMGAFTNYAGIDGMEPLAELAAAFFSTPQQTPEETIMDLSAIIKALGLKADATLEEVLAAIAKLTEAKASEDEAVAAATGKISKALGMAATSSADELVEACNALTIAARAKSPEVDPAQHVPMSVFSELQNTVAALTNQLTGDKVQTIVSNAIDEGKLMPSMAEWATRLGNKDIAELTAFIEASPNIAALTGTQTGGKEPADPTNFNLTATELHIASLTGLTPEQFAASKKAKENN